MFFGFLSILLFLVAGGVYLLIKKRYRGLGLALGMFFLVAAVGVWAIFQSRSSTAGIGILFLPFYGFFAGAMGWLFSNLRLAQHSFLRGIGWLCLVVSLAVPVILALQGFNSIVLNKTRDAKHKSNELEIARNRAIIKETLASAAGRESEAISRLITEHGDDRNFLLPILDSQFVSREALDRLARSDDLGIALSAARNPNCPTETLTRIYRTHSHPDYFFEALAAHKNTPPEVLADLYRRPVTIGGLDRSFASNPAMPRELLVDIAAKTKESFVVQRLLLNPALDCQLMELAESALKRSERPADGYSVARLQELKSSRCPITATVR